MHSDGVQQTAQNFALSRNQLVLLCSSDSRDNQVTYLDVMIAPANLVFSKTVKSPRHHNKQDYFYLSFGQSGNQLLHCYWKCIATIGDDQGQYP